MNLDISNFSHAYRLQRKASFLLGLRDNPDRVLTHGVTDDNLDLLTDSIFTRPQEESLLSELADSGHLAEHLSLYQWESALSELADPDHLAEHHSLLQEESFLPELADPSSQLEEHLRYSFQPVPPAGPESESTPARQDQLFDEIDYLRDRVLSDSILCNGIFLDRYRVATRDEGTGFPVLFRRDERELWWQIATYPTKEEAITAVNDLRRLLIRLSIASEGLYIIEHLLLRPLRPGPWYRHIYSEGLGDPDTAREFYSFKLSVFFPAWTARFSDAGFQRLAEATVRENCPAHVYPEFHWLNFSRMQSLEELYQRWLTAKNDTSAGPEAIDAAAVELARYIWVLSILPRMMQESQHESQISHPHP
ncbi:MAG: hypothetical protein ACE5Q6_01090 [Dehalococcoidia bacterium]